MKVFALYLGIIAVVFLGSISFFSHNTSAALVESFSPEITLRVIRPDLPQCSDGIDNDGDGLIDWPEDPGCESAEDDDETTPVFDDPTPSPVSPGAIGASLFALQFPRLPVIPPTVFLRVDFNGDDKVNIVDLSILLSYFGQSGPEVSEFDLDNDGTVGLVDLSIFMYYWRQ